MTIPEQAVEAGALALHKHEGTHAQPQPWNYEDARVVLEAAQPLMGVQRPDRESIKQAVLREIAGCNHMLIEAAHNSAERCADSILALPHTEQPQEGDGTLIVPTNPCLKKLCVDEPFFVLLGRDEQAPMAVERWADYRVAAEGKSEWTEQAREVANSMRAYRIARKAGLASKLPAAIAPQAGCAKEGNRELAQRCREVLEWKSTGLLCDGELRKLAASLTHIPETYRLDIAEKQTADEAMRALGSPPPPDKISFPRWWIQHLYTGLNRINTANVPGEAGDFIFTLRHQLLDKINETAPPHIAEEQTGAK